MNQVIRRDVEPIDSLCLTESDQPATGSLSQVEVYRREIAARMACGSGPAMPTDATIGGTGRLAIIAGFSAVCWIPIAYVAFWLIQDFIAG